MTGLWVDTDFGFDDLWALLLLRHLGCKVDGVSLVAGNSPLSQVASNAAAAKVHYGFDWPVWSGASKPIFRAAETAERILGPTGMKSRGLHLGNSQGDAIPQGAVDAMRDWVMSHEGRPVEFLALGPLTNLAHLLQGTPDTAERISRVVWMGGSTGAGNHTPLAEFNAVADAEALAAVLASEVRVDIVDLTFCRSITFAETDMPGTDALTWDLLGGYLDIALERGRPGMAIYDPLAAVAVARPECLSFAPCEVTVSTEADDTYGATQFTDAKSSRVRLATEANCDLTRLCLKALEGEPAHVH